MNSITIAGNITRDAETRYLPDGSAVAAFGLADNQGKDKQAIFWNCSLFGKRAESLAQYLTKGQAVTVTGTISEREFTDKNTGQQRKVMDVRVNDLALQGGKRESDSATAPRQRQAAPSQPRNDFEDDIPFLSSSMWHDITPSLHKRNPRTADANE